MAKLSSSAMHAYQQRTGVQFGKEDQENHEAIAQRNGSSCIEDGGEKLSLSLRERSVVALAPCWESSIAQFDLSLLKRLDLSKNRLRTVSGLEVLIGLEELSLYFNDLSSAEEIAFYLGGGRLSKLRVLDVRLNPLSAKTENNHRSRLIKAFLQAPLELLDAVPVEEFERREAASGNASFGSLSSSTSMPVITAIGERSVVLGKLRIEGDDGSEVEGEVEVEAVVVDSYSRRPSTSATPQPSTQAHAQAQAHTPWNDRLSPSPVPAPPMTSVAVNQESNDDRLQTDGTEAGAADTATAAVVAASAASDLPFRSSTALRSSPPPSSGAELIERLRLRNTIQGFNREEGCSLVTLPATATAATFTSSPALLSASALTQTQTHPPRLFPAVATLPHLLLPVSVPSPSAVAPLLSRPSYSPQPLPLHHHQQHHREQHHNEQPLAPLMGTVINAGTTTTSSVAVASSSSSSSDRLAEQRAALAKRLLQAGTPMTATTTAMQAPQHETAAAQEEETSAAALALASSRPPVIPQPQPQPRLPLSAASKPANNSSSSSNNGNRYYRAAAAAVAATKRPLEKATDPSASASASASTRLPLSPQPPQQPLSRVAPTSAPAVAAKKKKTDAPAPAAKTAAPASVPVPGRSASAGAASASASTSSLSSASSLAPSVVEARPGRKRSTSPLSTYTASTISNPAATTSSIINAAAAAVPSTRRPACTARPATSTVSSASSRPPKPPVPTQASAAAPATQHKRQQIATAATTTTATMNTTKPSAAIAIVVDTSVEKEAGADHSAYSVLVAAPATAEGAASVGDSSSALQTMQAATAPPATTVATISPSTIPAAAMALTATLPAKQGEGQKGDENEDPWKLFAKAQSYTLSMLKANYRSLKQSHDKYREEVKKLKAALLESKAENKEQREKIAALVRQVESTKQELTRRVGELEQEAEKERREKEAAVADLEAQVKRLTAEKAQLAAAVKVKVATGRADAAAQAEAAANEQEHELSGLRRQLEESQHALETMRRGHLEQLSRWKGLFLELRKQLEEAQK